MPRTALMKPLPLCEDWLSALKGLAKRDRNKLLNSLSEEEKEQNIQTLDVLRRPSPFLGPDQDRIYVSSWVQTMKEYGRDCFGVNDIERYLAHYEHINSLQVRDEIPAEAYEELAVLPSSSIMIGVLSLKNHNIDEQCASNLGKFISRARSLRRMDIQFDTVNAVTPDNDRVINDFSYKCWTNIIDGVSEVMRYFGDEGLMYLIDRFVQHRKELWSVTVQDDQSMITSKFINYALKKDGDIPPQSYLRIRGQFTPELIDLAKRCKNLTMDLLSV